MRPPPLAGLSPLLLRLRPLRSTSSITYHSIVQARLLPTPPGPRNRELQPAAVVGVHGEQGQRRGAGGLMQAAALGVTTGVAMGAAIDGPLPRRVSPHDASSMLEKGNRNKNGTKYIVIQAFDTILQLGVGYRLIA